MGSNPEAHLPHYPVFYQGETQIQTPGEFLCAFNFRLWREF